MSSPRGPLVVPRGWGTQVQREFGKTRAVSYRANSALFACLLFLCFVCTVLAQDPAQKPSSDSKPAIPASDLVSKPGDVMRLDIDPLNHPAWTGGTAKVMEKGRLAKFGNKYAGLGVASSDKIETVKKPSEAKKTSEEKK